MNFLYIYGIQLIVQLQALTWLTTPMRFFTFLGSEDFFILVLPVVYWCIDSELGIQIGFILVLSNGLNEIAKLALLGPRPYWISPQVKPLAAEATFGVPSGHSQNAVGVWGTIAARIGKRWVWIFTCLLIFLIGFSRIYLGVHFPHDVLAGWLVGSLILWGFLANWQRAADWLKRKGFLQQSLLALAVSAALVAAGILLVGRSEGYVLPAEWRINAERAGNPLPDPVSLEGILTSSGVFLGLALGQAWITRRGGFRPAGPFWKRSFCFIIGLIGILALYSGLKALFPADQSLAGSSLRFVRYAMIGGWVTGGAPYLFLRFKLVENPNRRVGILI